MTQIAVVSTDQSTLRDEIFGWTIEDSALFVVGKPIGWTPSPNHRDYRTVLEMLADGWRLLGPPCREVFVNDDGNEIVVYSWWLEK